MALTKTALLCRKEPAEIAGIADQEVAFAFNLQCADILNEWEQEQETEREKRMIEAMGGQVVARALGAGQPEPSNKVEHW